MKINIKKVILFFITFIFLYFVFVNLDIKKLFEIIKNFDSKYIFLLAVFILCSQICRAFCFKQLISKTINIPIKEAILLCLTGSALNIGFPARAGDLFRAFYTGQKYNQNKIKIFGSIILERIFDVFVIFCLLCIGIFIYKNNQIASNLCIFSGICIFIGIIMCIISYKYNKTEKICNYIKEKTNNFIFSKYLHHAIDFINNTYNSFFNGFEIIKSPKQVFIALLASFGIWSFECLCFITTMHAFGYNIHWSVSLFLISFIALACMLPSTSIFIGPYQAAVIAAFAMYKVNKEAALAISFTEQAMVTIVTTIFTIIFLTKNNISLSTIKEQIKK